MTLHTEIARRERILLLIAALLLFTGALTLAITNPQPLLLLSLAFGVWIVSFAVAHVLLCRQLPRRDPILLPVAALLVGCGFLLIGRLAINFLLRQTIWLLVSTIALLIIVRLSRDLRWLRRFRYTWLLGGLVLLTATLVLGVNPSGYGPRLWLGGSGVYFQPAELLKLLMIVYLASYLAERRDLIISEGRRIGRWHVPPLAYVGPLLVMFGLAVVLLAWQQDLGAAMLFFFTFLAMLYLATGKWGYAAAGLSLFAIAGIVGSQLSDKVALRVDGWLNPWPEAADRAFQIVQSLLAFGSGDIFGQGLGMGSPTYIPAVHTDFVFAALGEELGLVGVLAIIALFGVLMLRGFRAAVHARQPFGRFLAAGLTAGLVIQAWVIMAGNAKLAPIAGVTLPFVSYGGSSILTSFIALAFLLRLSDSQPAQPPAPDACQQPLFNLSYVLSAALALLALACGYWAILRAETLRAREDNPRRVLYEQRIVRGRILDREGTILSDVTVADDGTVTRRYPVPEAAPAVGYYSLRYGTGGIEAAFDAELRGEVGRSAWQAAWDDLLHHAPSGHDVQLTLDAVLQVQAQQALQRYGGAVVLLDTATGDILVLASSPTFNPEQLDETWAALSKDPGAPLVNRATQGLYQPGTALQTILVAEGLRADLIDLQSPFPGAAAAVAIGDAHLRCSADILEPSTLAAAYAAGCPAPFIDLGRQLGKERFAQAIERWGLTVMPPPLEIPTQAADWTAEAISTTVALEAESIGQGALIVSPLQMALVAGTLANSGSSPAPRLVMRAQDASGHWHEHPANGESRVILTPETARVLLDTWQRYGGDTAGHLGSAIAGQDQPLLAWFLGVAPVDASRYAVAVLLEHSDDPQRAAEIGIALLETAAR